MDHQQIWEPIRDLPANWKDLAVGGLSSLGSVWTGQHNKLRNSKDLDRFHQRLSREWAIETGIIENLYTLDRGTTQLLIEHGIDTALFPHGATNKPVEVVVRIVEDHQEALEGLFDFVANRRPLTTSYIKELHQLLTRHQTTTTGTDTFGRVVEIPLLRGAWKTSPNNPTRPDGRTACYCPPEHVASEMDELVAMQQRHESERVPPEVEAAWLHHRFTQIHPFQDGNGRVARTIASLVFLRAGWFPLLITRDNRAEYIDALEKADQGDLGPLIELFGAVQRKALVRALSISENVLREAEPLANLLIAATERLRDRNTRNYTKQRKVFEISNEIVAFTQGEFDRVSKPLNESVQSISPRYYATVESSTDENNHWFKHQIITTAKDLDYFADTRTYRSWVRLRIKDEQQTQLIVSFHSLGVEFVGLVAVSAFVEFRQQGEDGIMDIDGPIPVCKEVFQFAYNEAYNDVLVRYESWLKEVILVGLDQWRRHL